MESVIPMRDAEIHETAMALRRESRPDEASRSHVVTVSRQWRRDLMPPGMVRPLATSTLGDIIVLALRLRMRWRTLKPESGQLLADGNGYNLSATQIAGLGIVFNFTAARMHKKPPSFIPSRPVDKLT